MQVDEAQFRKDIERLVKGATAAAKAKGAEKKAQAHTASR